MFYILLATYGTILLSELIGDKSIYTISSLAMRFRPLYVFCGFTAAFMAKMLLAVLLGRVIAELPTSLVAITSTVTFFLTALIIWFKKSDERPIGREHEKHFSRAALITFGAILFSEWGDVGQIMAATLTARYRMPLLVWLGATLALVTKGLLALLLGRGLRKHIPLQMLRPISASLCLLMGVISAIEPMFKT
ncbi:MAG: TMEM165/GDT1 family protein [Pyrinomonadaceae bacterium]